MFKTRAVKLAQIISLHKGQSKIEKKIKGTYLRQLIFNTIDYNYLVLQDYSHNFLSQCFGPMAYWHLSKKHFLIDAMRRCFCYCVKKWLLNKGYSFFFWYIWLQFFMIISNWVVWGTFFVFQIHILPCKHKFVKLV